MRSHLNKPPPTREIRQTITVRKAYKQAAAIAELQHCLAASRLAPRTYAEKSLHKRSHTTLGQSVRPPRAPRSSTWTILELLNLKPEMRGARVLRKMRACAPLFDRPHLERESCCHLFLCFPAGLFVAIRLGRSKSADHSNSQNVRGGEGRRHDEAARLLVLRHNERLGRRLVSWQSFTVEALGCFLHMHSELRKRNDPAVFVAALDKSD